MYCRNCGAKLEDNSNFCHECGTNINNQAIVQNQNYEITNASTTNKQELLNQIETARRYANIIENDYNNILATDNEKKRLEHYRQVLKSNNKLYISLRKELQARKEQWDTHKDFEKYLKFYNYDTTFIKKCKILNAIPLFIVIIALIISKTVSKVDFLYVSLYILFIIGIIVVLAISEKIYKKAAYQIIDEREAIINSQSQEIYNHASNCLNEYNNKYGVISEKYICNYALSYIYDCVFSGRADSFKEAYNLFEMYEMNQAAIRKSDEKYQQLLQQQQNMFKTYQRNEAIDGLMDTLILLSIAFK